MARVSVETRVLAERRLEILMKVMGWRKARAIGTLVLIWHDSQEKLLTHASKRQMLDWIDARHDQEAEKILSALVRAGYVDEDEDGEYHIRGNKKHVDAFSAMRSGASKGGKASGVTRKNNSLAEGRVQIDRSLPQARVEPNTLHSNSSHSNSLHPISSHTISDLNNCIDLKGGDLLVIPELLNGSERCNRFFSGVTKDTQKVWLKLYKDPEWIKNQLRIALEWLEEQPNREEIQHYGRWFGTWLKKAYAKEIHPQPDLFLKPEAVQANLELNRATWESYRMSVVDRWGKEPTRNAKVNSCISNFVKRVGSEAPEVIRFFVAHNDTFYVKKTHDVSLALRDAETLSLQWHRGRAITSSDMRQFEAGQHHREQMERVEKGEL